MKTILSGIGCAALLSIGCGKVETSPVDSGALPDVVEASALKPCTGVEQEAPLNVVICQEQNGCLRLGNLADPKTPPCQDGFKLEGCKSHDLGGSCHFPVYQTGFDGGTEHSVEQCCPKNQ